MAAERDFNVFDEDYKPPPPDLDADPQPRKRGPGRPPGSKNKVPPNTTRRNVRKTAQQVTRDPIGGVLLASFLMLGSGWKAADPVCGQAFIDSAPDIARELANMAANDDAVYDFLATLTMKGGLAVILATLPVAVTVVNHHVKPRWQKRREDAAAENAATGPEMEGNSDTDVA